VVLCDLSPSNSALNCITALSCDYILSPCNASLYSTVSVAGLLETVLQNPNNSDSWLAKHEKLKKHFHADDLEETDPTTFALREWFLPKLPPKLLPILVTNYPLNKKDNRVQVTHSHFVYTIMAYINTDLGKRDKKKIP
jgi:cellulose biosynthesis protein BcsQ